MSDECRCADPQRCATSSIVRKLTRDEACALGDRLREIFREAVTVAGPRLHSPAQVAVWADGARPSDRWDDRLRDGSTWVAAWPDRPDRVVGMAIVEPAGHLDLLYVDPALHRRGIASDLLRAVESDARDAGIAALATEASLVAHPLFAARGYALVAWESIELRGQSFRRALMRKVLR